jgi:predicted transcriptional regulator
MVFLLGKNRNRLSIIAAILDAANLGSSKTHIMYQANLSFNLLEKYLGLASNSELVELKGYKYHLTQRGKDFLRHYRNFEERYEKAQKLLDSLSFEREQLTKSFGRTQNLLKSSNAILESE